MENGNFRLLLQTENSNGKQKFVFLGRKTINGSQLLLFQQTCSSVITISLLSRYQKQLEEDSRKKDSGQDSHHSKGTKGLPG
jgi:hypothetical protein